MNDAHEKTAGNASSEPPHHVSIRRLENAPGEMYRLTGEVLGVHERKLEDIATVIEHHQDDLEELRKQMSSALHLITTPRQTTPPCPPASAT